MLQRQVGDIVITRILESERPDFDAAQFFPEIAADQWAPYRQRLAGWALEPASNALTFPLQSFLLRARHHTIVVDPCVGDHKQRARPTWNMTSSGEYLKRLADTGVRPEDVDYVMCTHMHPDHVGWNTRLENGRWVPTFPNAKYLMSRIEHDIWAERASDTARPQWSRNVYQDSVLPVVEKGMAVLVHGTHSVDDCFTIHPAPGHTPGTCRADLESGGEGAIFCGDIIH